MAMQHRARTGRKYFRGAGKRSKSLWGSGKEMLESRLLLSTVYNSRVMYTFPTTANPGSTSIVLDSVGDVYGVAAYGGTANEGYLF